MRIHLRDALLSSFILTVSAESSHGSGVLVAQKSANSTEVIPSPLVVPPSQYCKFLRIAGVLS